MELSILIKLAVTLISALGGLAAYKLNSLKVKQTKAVLIKQLEEALENKNHYSTCELFALVYGQNMNYSDILKLMKRDDLNKILYAIEKSPGMIKFENGTIGYNTIYKNASFRKFDTIIMKVITYGAAALVAIILLLLMPFSTGPLVIISLAFAVIAFTIFALQLKEMWHGNMIRKLVDQEIIKRT